ncbi:uncharacterized protein [Palaemon carinicauda]|uniref:uncharacterized protein n=1 Tax=Palaemon carinicauda TaxID=392227 RepID=UPI0035B675E0
MRSVKLGGNVNDRITVLGHYRLQFGIYRDQTFKWMIENGLGYAAWIVDCMRSEVKANAPLSQNKFSFREYMLSFDEGKEAVALKEKERVSRQKKTTVQPSLSSKKPSDSAQPSSGKRKRIDDVNPSAPGESSLLVGETLSSPSTKGKTKKMKGTPTKAKCPATASPNDDIDDEALVTAGIYP